jgi:hypothetical protein
MGKLIEENRIVVWGWGREGETNFRRIKGYKIGNITE